MTNEEKAREIYSTVLIEVNGWSRERVESLDKDDIEDDSLYEKILEIIED